MFVEHFSRFHVLDASKLSTTNGKTDHCFPSKEPPNSDNLRRK